jgi:hypothetical protein
VATRRVSRRLHDGINFVQVDAHEATAGAVAGEPALVDHVADRAWMNLQVVGGLCDGGVAAAAALSPVGCGSWRLNTDTTSHTTSQEDRHEHPPEGERS